MCVSREAAGDRAGEVWDGHSLDQHRDSGSPESTSSLLSGVGITQEAEPGSFHVKHRMSQQALLMRRRFVHADCFFLTLSQFSILLEFSKKHY